MNLEVDFSERLTPILRVMRISVTFDNTHGFITNNLESFLSFRIDYDLIRSMNLVIRKNTILQHEPSMPPSFTIIHPFLKYSRYSIPDEVVDPNVNRRMNHRELTSAAAITSSVSGDCGGGRFGGGRRKRRHGEMSGRLMIGDCGDAAERMHIIG